MGSIPESQETSKSAVQGLHQLSPYIGRLAVHRARSLVTALCRTDQTVVDPFCGSGTVPVEGWNAGMNVVAGDLSPYATAITRAKLFPLQTSTLAIGRLELISSAVPSAKKRVDLRTVPEWVRDFYHPETLREAIAWARLLRKHREFFLFGCFLNLVHHQRPGFLSYPASHATPYLRSLKFPKAKFSDMYEYRDVRSRLEKKVIRALKYPLEMNFDLSRKIVEKTAYRTVSFDGRIDAVITSPPYMSGLAYARDNRLRLWFCGVGSWESLEPKISPPQNEFEGLMARCATEWESWLRPGGYIAVVLGDIHRDQRRTDVCGLVLRAFDARAKSLKLIALTDEKIPEERRLVRGNQGTKTETTIIFQKKTKR
jgi:hypothetical protein